ncbi:hypothetical protein OROGR_001317 [Orobanche gracilis]
MDLIFPLKIQYVSPSYKILSSWTIPNVLSLRGFRRSSRPFRVKTKIIRVRSESARKVNGAVTTEFDSRFLDRPKST